MGSLFTRIFLAFWLAAVLLGAVLFVLERKLGDQELGQIKHWLGAHAETASTLFAEGEFRALSHWLTSIRREQGHPVFILNEQGQPPFAHFLPPVIERRGASLAVAPGVHRLYRGRYVIFAQISAPAPALYLGTVVNLGRLHGLSPLARISIALIISGLVSLGLATLMTRPIRRLRVAAQALAAGDLTVRVGGSGRDEVAALGRDFDIMADRLREMLESQRRLLRDVSHELRSPLARLRVALELVERAEDREHALRRIEKEADELERLVSNLLSLARLESGQAVLEAQPVLLRELLQAVVNDADFEAQARRRHVMLQAGHNCRVHGDPVLLRAAVENVIRNAIRHTHQDTTVEVHLRCGTDRAVIEVCDEGSGVPPAELDRMFEPFTRVGEDRARNNGGFGLGLAITGQVMTAHGGTVMAENRPNGGLCIALNFPLAGGGAGITEQGSDNGKP